MVYVSIIVWVRPRLWETYAVLRYRANECLFMCNQDLDCLSSDFGIHQRYEVLPGPDEIGPASSLCACSACPVSARVDVQSGVGLPGQHRAITSCYRAWGLFLESPETFRAHFGWHNSFFIFKARASRGTNLAVIFIFYSLYNIIWKDQLYRISRSKFYEWLFGSEKFSGLSRNGPETRLYVDG